MTRVLVVEDEDSFSDAISYMLRKEGFEVAVCPTGPDALETFDRSGADLVLLDLMLPGLPGSEVCRTLRERSNVPVIMLTAKDSEIDKVVGLELGADDYVTKPFSVRELVARIRAVLRRAEMRATPTSKSEEEAAQITRGRLSMDPARHRVSWSGRDVTLTVTEFMILEALAQRPGVVKSRNQLMDVAYQDDVYVDDRTIDSHIKRLRRKFRAVDGEFKAIDTLYGVGYRFAEE